LNRSALIREALRAHLKNLEIRERELRDRKGYEGSPINSGDLSSWEEEAIWPEE
jgi:Arc/MetJ-type ribon-helix-helix transcriptional regulator